MVSEQGKLELGNASRRWSRSMLTEQGKLELGKACRVERSS